MKAIIALEDGTIFEGTSFGAEGEQAGEVVFNTQIIGYQEILTDPAYRGQIIAMGYPHIGNYGINDRCFESDSTHAIALIVKEYSKIVSNWQATGPLDKFMKENGVIGIEGIDTRALTIHIRDNGEMTGIVSTKNLDAKSLLNKIKGGAGRKSQIPNPKSQTNSKFEIKSSKVIIDIGVNKSTIGAFKGAQLVPQTITADKILESKVEEVIISSGPGDPRELKGLIAEVKQLVGKVKINGVQNGACVVAQALGCPVYRMKVGHHGMNHPVVDPKTGKGEITSQNHSYGIEKVPASVEVVHVNLNDKTIEKIKTKDSSCEAALYFPIDERGKLPADYRYVV